MMFILFSLLILTQINAQTIDFCQGRYDGTYCSGIGGPYLYYCQFGRTTNVQACTYCTQTSLYVATCSNFGVPGPAINVPSNYCSTKTNGWSCYSAIGSSIYVSVRCDSRIVIQQQTCAGSCDFYSGICSTNIGTTAPTTAPCPLTCTYGCNYGTVICKPPPFCAQTKILSSTDAPFCGTQSLIFNL